MFFGKKVGDFNKKESESLIFTDLEIPRDYKIKKGGKEMDMDTFRYVIVLAECKSISEAARRLFLSQPALTKHLNKLEEGLGAGAKLFDRSTVPIKITPIGEIFLEYSKQYMELESEMRDRLNAELRLQKGSIRIALTDSGGNYLGYLISSFLEQYPDIKLKLQNESALRCEQLLEQEEVDILVCTDPIRSNRMEYVPLLKEALVIVVPRKHPILEGKDIEKNSLENLCELDAKELRGPGIRFVLATPEHSMYLSEQVFLEKYGIDLVNPLYIDYINTRYSVACGGAGIAIMPFSMVQKKHTANKPVFCTVKGARMVRQIVIAKIKGKALSAAGEIFWDFIIKESLKNHN